jgi:hypothetical protein
LRRDVPTVTHLLDPGGRRQSRRGLQQLIQGECYLKFSYLGQPSS